MFLDNKYTNLYYSLINRAHNRKLDTYKERHHVIPKSLGGTNDPSNLAELTAREHFICHRLLIKMTVGIHRTKMVRALSAFRAARSYQIRNLTSKQYELIRTATAGQAWNKGIPHSAETRAKISEKAKGRQRILSAETLDSIKQKLRSRIVTDEHRKNLSIALSKRHLTYKKEECPECGRLIGVNNKARHALWHQNQ